MSDPAVRLGVLLPTREHAEDGRARDVVAVAAAAERAGADSVWVGDSLFARPRLDPLTLLAAVATATSTATLGTAVLVAPQWNPLLLARAAATVDVLSGGRLVLGLGPGPDYGPARKEFAALGVPHRDRMGRLAEVVEVCRALWGRGPVGVDGRRWSFRNVDLHPKPAAPGGPPVWWGVRGPRGLALAGGRGDGWLPTGRGPDHYAEGLAAVHAAATGPVAAAVYLTVAVDDDADAAVDRMRESQTAYYRAPWPAVRELEDHCAGTAETVAAHVAAYVRAGAEHVVLRFAGGDPVAQFARLRAAVRRDAARRSFRSGRFVGGVPLES
ncbi:LLM class flavin-dependent oxidoreductase [Pseudonocardia sp. RS11V-5]|uniref:LLM class flavin-dependent oxidoreductase n=1 Tax=Pseudonocardia terrae TaxID=2905831 RepID=UPI001E529BA9|nr:LLM class flavin-dependent oxidoreductase [Pseudonocardia terrae]MCE3551112.1 LLM class flavin-dependent oxidoreductase [Pseudonocardia terrae]